MRLRSLWGLGILLVAVAAGAAEDEGAASEPAGEGEVRVGGMYDVTGVTVNSKDGSSRAIYGRVVLAVEGDRYKSHFELSTRFPGSEAAAARVVGTGQGDVKGNVLEGDADVHLVLAGAPGVDVGFAYIPAEMGARIVSKTRAEVQEDETVRIEIENHPAEGEDYTPTHTSLVGYRIGPR
jgi:hypothetical protein